MSHPQNACCFKTIVGHENQLEEDSINSGNNIPSSEQDNDSAESGMRSETKEIKDASSSGFVESQSGSLDKTPGLQSAHLTRASSSNKVLSEIVVTLQAENAGLRNVNDQFSKEIASLRKDNKVLKSQVQQHTKEEKKLLLTIKEVKTLNRKLSKDIQNEQKLHNDLEKEHEDIRQSVKEKIQEENANKAKEIETLKLELSQKDKHIQEVVAELSEMTKKCKVHERLRDCQLEILHQLDVLKQEKAEALGDRDSLKQQQKQLIIEINYLKDTVQDIKSELRNEQWRHSVLTKEFNSLLNENTRLKTQLRQRLISTTPASDTHSTSAITSRQSRDRPKLVKRNTCASFITKQSSKSAPPALPHISKTEGKVIASHSNK